LFNVQIAIFVLPFLGAALLTIALQVLQRHAAWHLPWSP
jgi:hypothetical protein